MNKKFWTTTFTLTGTIVGAGILGLPYVFAESGLIIGIFWLIVIGTIMTFTSLALGEVTLRTRGKHQISGYAQKYLGKSGKLVTEIAIFLGIYSALLAYLIGEGQSLSQLIAPSINPIAFGIIFWAIITLLLQGGLKELKKIGMWGATIIIAIISVIFVKFLPTINPAHLTTTNLANFAAPIGVVMFSLLGFISIPELRKEIKGQEKLFKKAIILGSLIPIILYILFSITLIGVLGNSITEIATLSFGPIMTILGIFTMLTSYFVLSYSLSTTFKFDLKIKKYQNFIFSSLVPLILYLLVAYFKLATFTIILGVGGVLSGGITGILILLMAKKAKSHTRNNKDPEFQIPITIPIIIMLSTIFIIGIILELLP